MKTNCESVSKTPEGAHPWLPYPQHVLNKSSRGSEDHVAPGLPAGWGKHSLCTCEPWGWGEAAPLLLHLQLASEGSSYNVPWGWVVASIVAPAACLCAFSALGGSSFSTPLCLSSCSALRASILQLTSRGRGPSHLCSQSPRLPGHQLPGTG